MRPNPGGMIETARAVYELLRLAAISRFRVRGRYWTWRHETAFGRGKPESRKEMMKAALDYGRWVSRTRRAGRSRY